MYGDTWDTIIFVARAQNQW